MGYAQRMLETSPGSLGFDAAELGAAIEALLDCAQACTACADACLAEEHLVQLVTCIRLNLDCADVCQATARALSRQRADDGELTRALLQACIKACRACGAECEHHAGMGMTHCAVCAEACRRCADACEALLAKLPA